MSNNFLDKELGAKEARLVARTNEEIRDQIAAAADLLGASMSQFIIEASLERAARVMTDMTRINVSVQGFTTIMAALERPARDLPRLQEAALRYQRLVEYEPEDRDLGETPQ